MVAFGLSISLLSLVQNLYGKRYKKKIKQLIFSLDRAYDESHFQFQRYLGVHEGAAVPSSKQAKAIEEEEAEADFDDDDMDEDEDGDVGPGIMPDPVTGLIDVKKIHVPAPGKPTTEQKLKAFFNDPEKSIKIFMSSYSRSMGYIWYQIFLFDLFLKKKERKKKLI